MLFTSSTIRSAGIGAALAAALILSPNLSAASQEAADSARTVTVWEVDRSGHPPFPRRRVEVPVVDAAVLESIAEESVATLERWHVERSGKPPFERRRMEMPVVDAAAMEILDAEEADRPRFRGRPPFRRH